ncbi:TlpA family protein disulfide reductase [Sphingobacterium sp. E70]|uniref:TlpA family protein disulfide reductase n=1 Tax=Sphingobacterium sp. E70 TaxID=2853439 RepID=UPI00211CAF7F|nr:TlpA disulfide reductase family protein [Sphingobacterium sp. E70]ULT23588.1 TlpA family protein disulfide reductase [Sphingobacterium sp. E70]
MLHYGMLRRDFYFRTHGIAGSNVRSFFWKCQKSKIWNLLYHDLHNALIKEGHPFPLITLKDQKNEPQKLTIPKNKIVLVDFWFSNCRPCLAAFPKLISLYDHYKDKGFEIIGISTDQTKRIDNWKKAIQEQNLPWKQFLDENGTITSSSMYIRMFPTAILIDRKGNIINKKISLSDLEDYLIKELN